jgi:hypothetical protein
MEYRVWQTVPIGNACLLDPIQGAAPERHLIRGERWAGGFPKGVRFEMSKRHKKETGLLDDVMNMDAVKVCSRKLVEFLRDRKLKNVDYLPVTILDHKGKVASSEYSIVHPVAPQDALDLDGSEPTYSPLMKTEIDEVRRLRVDPRRVDPEVRLFRLAAYFFPVLVDAKLAEEIRAAGFQGPYFTPLEEYEP